MEGLGSPSKGTMSHRGWVLRRWLPPFVIRVCCFFQALWVKNYMISEGMINLASPYILAYIDLFYTLAKKYYVSVLVPTVLILWQILLVVCTWLWKFVQILLCWASTGTWWLLRYAWKHPGKALLRLCHWGYYVLVVLFQEDAYNIILRAIQYQVLFTLVMAFLDWFEALIHKEIVKVFQFLLYVQSRWGPVYSVEACCISVLPSGGLPLCRRFPGPRSPTVLPVFNSFSFLLVHVDVEKKIRHCYLGDLGVLYYSRIEGKSTLKSFSHDLIHEIKTTFTTFFLLYLYNTFTFIKMIK